MSYDSVMQESCITAVREELMGLKALAPYVPKEEFDERIGAILSSLAHPPSSAAAVSTFAALAEWVAKGLISEDSAAGKRRAMFDTFDTQMLARRKDMSIIASDSENSGGEHMLAGAGSSSVGADGHHGAIHSSGATSLSKATSNKRIAVQVHVEAKKFKPAHSRRTLECPVCSKLFYGQQGLSSHIKFIHKVNKGDSTSLKSSQIAGENEPKNEATPRMEEGNMKSSSKSTRRIYTAKEKQNFLDIYDVICQDRNIRSFTEKFQKETGVASSNISKWAKPETRAQIAASVLEATAAELDVHERAEVAKVVESVVAQIAGANEPELEIRSCLDQVLAQVEIATNKDKVKAKRSRDYQGQSAEGGSLPVKEKRKGSERRRIYTAHEKQAFLNNFDAIRQDKSVRSFTDKFEEETGVAASNISKWSKPEMRAQIAASIEKAAAAELSHKQPSPKKRRRVFAL